MTAQTRSKHQPKLEPFHYSAGLELALEQFYGHASSWYGSAGSFQNPLYVRKAIIAATRAIRRRLQELLTADDRLRLTTALTLDGIERDARLLSATHNNVLDLLGRFINLTAYLLGFDWLLGKPYRQVVYFQTLDQQRIDDRMRHPASPYEQAMLERDKRVGIASRLFDDGIRVGQIARIMNLSETITKDLLVRAGKIVRDKNTKDTSS